MLGCIQFLTHNNFVSHLRYRFLLAPHALENLLLNFWPDSAAKMFQQVLTHLVPKTLHQFELKDLQCILSFGGNLKSENRTVLACLFDSSKQFLIVIPMMLLIWLKLFSFFSTIYKK